jgi:hypothetical protein
VFVVTLIGGGVCVCVKVTEIVNLVLQWITVCF